MLVSKACGQRAPSEHVHGVWRAEMWLLTTRSPVRAQAAYVTHGNHLEEVFDFEHCEGHTIVPVNAGGYILVRLNPGLYLLLAHYPVCAARCYGIGDHDQQTLQHVLEKGNRAVFHTADGQARKTKVLKIPETACY